MNEQSNLELLEILRNMGELETVQSKIDGAIFVKKSKKLIDEKISYLYYLLQIEASNYGQKSSDYFKNIELMVSKYNKKLNMIYEEFYCQYVNIQNEIQKARLNQRILMVKYQKLINDTEKNIEIYKKEFEQKNDLYMTIIEKCYQNFKKCQENFKAEINNEFLIESALQLVNEKNIFKKLGLKISNLFIGAKRYAKILDSYMKKIDKIDSLKLANQTREETVSFVVEILEMNNDSQFLNNIV